MRNTQRRTAGETSIAYLGGLRGVRRRMGGHVKQLLARSHGEPRRAAMTVALASALAMPALGGCDALTKNDQLPPNLTDPAITETPEGALQVYRGTLVQLLAAVGQGHVPDENGGSASVVGISGELSDELQNAQVLAALGGDPAALLGQGVVDRRTVPDAGTDVQTDSAYARLQKVRGQASQAIGLLQDYLPDSAALRGHAYALAGYAEVFLAELFCSGVPLSTLDYKGDYTLQPGSSTDAVFAHAAALFDSTLKYASANATVMDLARIGKARALLGRGDYVQAAAIAGAVADDYTYAMHYIASELPDSLSSLFGPAAYVRYRTTWVYNVADHEGVHGLDYVSSGDPRTATQILNGNRIPTKYTPFDGSAPIVLASGVEARLIEAEAALQAEPAGSAWLDKLNALRTDGTADPATTLSDTLGITGCDPQHLCGADGMAGGTFQLPPGATLASSTALDLSNKPELQQACVSGSSYAPCSESPAHTTVNVYTVPPQWHAGTGQVAGLAPLSDPGTPDGRVDLLFRERAFWLFLTGHRQGDLRRLIRQYHRQPDAVYPFGPYYTHGGSYGTTVALPIPAAERQANPLFTGGACAGA